MKHYIKAINNIIDLCLEREIPPATIGKAINEFSDNCNPELIDCLQGCKGITNFKSIKGSYCKNCGLIYRF